MYAYILYIFFFNLLLFFHANWSRVCRGRSVHMKEFCHFDACQDYDCLLSDLKNTAKMEHYFFKKLP